MLKSENPYYTINSCLPSTLFPDLNIAPIPHTPPWLRGPGASRERMTHQVLEKLDWCWPLRWPQSAVIWRLPSKCSELNLKSQGHSHWQMPWPLTVVLQLEQLLCWINKHSSFRNLSPINEVNIILGKTDRVLKTALQNGQPGPGPRQVLTADNTGRGLQDSTPAARTQRLKYNLYAFPLLLEKHTYLLVYTIFLFCL